MLEWISMLYGLYNYYIFMGIFFACAVIAYQKKKQTYVWSIIERSVLIFIVFMLGICTSLLIKWLPVRALGEFVRVIIGLAISIIFGWNSTRITNWMIVTTRKLCSKKYISQWGYSVAIFVLWMMQLMTQLPEKIADWVECWYAVNYSMGLGSRFFVGSILSLFYDEYMDRALAYWFCVAMVILLAAICSYMLGKLLNKTKYKMAVLFLLACFWACPASLASYWNAKNFGRLEMYTLLVSLAFIGFFLRIRRRWLKYGVLCVGIILCNAIYQGFVFMYFPLVFIVALCEAYKNKFAKQDLIGGIFVLLSVCTSFLFFQFGTSIAFETQAEFEAAIAARSNVSVSSVAIMCELFMDIPQVFKDSIVPFITGEDLPREILTFTIAVFSPIIVIGIGIYTKCFEEYQKKGKRFLQSPYLWCLLCQFAILPQFLLNIDWGRWIIAVVAVFFFGIFYMLYMELEEMETAIAALDCFVKKHYYIALMIVLYFTLFTKFTEDGMKHQIYIIFNNVMKFVNTLL